MRLHHHLIQAAISLALTAGLVSVLVPSVSLQDVMLGARMGGKKGSDSAHRIEDPSTWLFRADPNGNPVRIHDVNLGEVATGNWRINFRDHTDTVRSELWMDTSGNIGVRPTGSVRQLFWVGRASDAGGSVGESATLGIRFEGKWDPNDIPPLANKGKYDLQVGFGPNSYEMRPEGDFGISSGMVLRLRNSTSGTRSKPACSGSGDLGKIWLDASDPNSHSLEVCMKPSGSAYGWQALCSGC